MTTQTASTEIEDWYDRRDELEPGQVFCTKFGNTVRLDRRIPCDGTDWYADVWTGHCFAAVDFALHPSDLLEQVQDPSEPRPRKITGRSALRVDDVTRPE